MRPLILLRPEPGLSQSAERAVSLGLEVIGRPLFRIEPVAATLPEERFEAVVVTSANAVRHGRAILDRLRGLPVHAVGEGTAAALREAGIEPAQVGSGGAEGMTLPAGAFLHLCGAVHRPLGGAGVAVPVYRARALDGALPDLAGAVVAVHSPAAGARLDMLAPPERSHTIVAAISQAAGAACGSGWERIASSDTPDDTALLALAAALCQSDGR